jgi:SSS family solute:Na+ symporter
MNLVTLDYIVILLFAIALLTFAFYVKRSENYRDFAVGSKTFGSELLIASFLATLIGPGFSIGMVGRGFSTGLYFLLGAIAYGIGYWLFGSFLSPKLAEMKDVYSIGEIMETKYGNWGKRVTGFISFILLAGFVAIMVKVGGELLSSVSGLNMWISVALIATSVTAYTLFGGMKTSVFTDAFQAVIFSVILLILLFMSATSAPISTTEAVSKGITSGVNKLSDMSWLAVIGFIFSLMFGEVLLPPVIGRALSAKSKKDSSRAFSFTGLLVPTVLGLFLLMGIFANSGLVATGTANDKVLIKLASSQLGAGMLGLFVAALLSIVMSSMDSMLQSGAVSVTSDVFGFKHENKKSLVTSRIATIILGILGGVLALLIPDLISTLLIIYSLWVPVIMIPLLYAVFSDSINKWAGPAAMILGGISSYLWEYIFSNPLGLPGIIFGTIVSWATMEIIK